MNYKEYFDNIAPEWDKISEQDEKKVSEIIELVNLTKGAKVLDVGCGTGVLTPFIINKIGSEGKLVCLDISEKMIKIASSKFPKNIYSNIDFVCEDILNYETDCMFDYILCYSSFPHFIDKERSIKKMGSILSINGKLCIMHSQSRKDINNLHKSINGVVSNDYLPSIDEITSIFKVSSLASFLMIDEKDKYVVVGLKEE